MNKFESMQIPKEADGIVDNEEAFQKMQEANEISLSEEIRKANESQDELHIGDYEDMEFVEHRESSEKDLAIAKRKRVLGAQAFKHFSLFSR